MSVDKEAESIAELRKRLKADMDSDMFEDEYLFFRFLKYHDFNVDAAEKMLRDNIEFRKKYDVKNILTQKQPEVFEKYMPNIKLGYDKQGCIVRYVPSGNIDWLGILDSCKREDLVKRVIHQHEKDLIDIREQTRKLGRKAGRVFFIHNMENFSFTQATDKRVISNIIYLFKIYINNYPKTLKAINVINASIYFEILYSLVKNFLPSSILEKVKVYSDDKFKEEFLKNIDADVLPAFLGGNRTDPDGNPLCLSFINHGGPVPENYYIHKSKRSLSMLPDVKKVTISNATFHEEFIEVTEPDSYLEWEIEIKCRDVGFGLFYQDAEENKTEIVPVQRINTDEYAESGVYKCHSVGTYIIVFDNTYSYIRSKVIYYKIKVLTPSEESSLLID